MKGFRVFDTTADMGLEIYGTTREELFRNALKGLFYIITDLDRVEPKEDIAVEVQGEDWADLLVGWLNELVFLQDAQGWLFKECTIEELGAFRIRAQCLGERFKNGKHCINTLVKAATYHRAQIEETPHGYRAQVVLDV